MAIGASYVATKVPTAGRRTAREAVLTALRTALLTGRMVPGRPETLRGLAEELGVSPMPVREAAHRLAAEGALEIRRNGGLHVPLMSEARLREIARVRCLLEPDLVHRALPALTRTDHADLTEIDNRIDDAILHGDIETYMRLNHAFHFRLYRGSHSTVILPLVESVWLQFGPFMRMVAGRVGTRGFVDRHKQALDAIGANDGDGLAEAVRADIREGMLMIGASLFDWPDGTLDPEPADGDRSPD